MHHTYTRHYSYIHTCSDSFSNLIKNLLSITKNLIHSQSKAVFLLVVTQKFNVCRHQTWQALTRVKTQEAELTLKIHAAAEHARIYSGTSHFEVKPFI